MFRRADVPAVFVKFWAAVSSGFWMAGCDKRGKRFPNYAVAERLAIREGVRVTKTKENEADVVASVSPDFVDGFYGLPFFIFAKSVI